MVSAHKRHDSFALICFHLRLKPFLGLPFSSVGTGTAYAYSGGVSIDSPWKVIVLAFHAMRLTTAQKVGLALLIPATGAALALLLFYSFLIDTAADSAFINIAGRQRMLSQQLFSYTQMAHQFGHKEDQQALRGLIDEFEHSR